MEWLNYHHLYYFWVVARAGTISGACRQLLLSPATISAQLRELEHSLGNPLFHRIGRSLRLTELGRVALGYADEIFGLGQELLGVIKRGEPAAARKLRVGVDDALSKQFTFRLLQPVFEMKPPTRIVCIEGTPLQLLPPLAAHDLDVVISDRPADPTVRVRAFSHLLAECGVWIMAERSLATKLRRGYPKSLNGAPALLPTPGTALRQSLDQYFERADVRPHVVGEFEDSALLAACGHRRVGFFAVPAVLARAYPAAAPVSRIGVARGIRTRVYAITVERRAGHPAVEVMIRRGRAAVMSDSVTKPESV